MTANDTQPTMNIHISGWDHATREAVKARMEEAVDQMLHAYTSEGTSPWLSISAGVVDDMSESEEDEPTDAEKREQRQREELEAVAKTLGTYRSALTRAGISAKEADQLVAAYHNGRIASWFVK